MSARSVKCNRAKIGLVLDIGMDDRLTGKLGVVGSGSMVSSGGRLKTTWVITW